MGTFAASKVQGFSDEEAVKRASYAGAFKAMKQETGGSPTKTELDAFIQKVEALTCISILLFLLKTVSPSKR